MQVMFCRRVAELSSRSFAFCAQATAAGWFVSLAFSPSHTRKSRGAHQQVVRVCVQPRPLPQRGVDRVRRGPAKRVGLQERGMAALGAQVRLHMGDGIRSDAFT